MVESRPNDFTASRIAPAMSIRRSINASNLRTALLLISNRLRTPSPYQLANASIYKQRYGYSMNQQGLRFLTVSRGFHSEPGSSSMMGKDEEDKDHQSPNDQPPVPPPAPKRNFTTWAKWLLGSILAIVLPFWKQKWEDLKTIEGAVEVAAEKIEEVAEAVEKVADVAEKVAEDVANSIPEDGPIKEAALIAEHVAEEVAKESHITQQIIHTIDELEKEVESLIDPLGTKGKNANGRQK